MGGKASFFYSSGEKTSALRSEFAVDKTVYNLHCAKRQGKMRFPIQFANAKNGRSFEGQQKGCL